ncbi:hypothetical protein GJV85_13095 [Sulfurimonas aquatica]|uniref:Uncharacterized protein n=1 Tax=Sulfurimonas aquatica TaxID=2672570 RepID=A0A975B2L6_9BACT|nr:hypothetical protein [Sulfurimonas aquatica]QSZ43000.1 hypothetical protein GJV85_13095 [Sulfurimonas aquatica]
MKTVNIRVFFSVMFLIPLSSALFLSACCENQSFDNFPTENLPRTIAYTVQVADDNVIDATVQANACDNGVEVGNGIYKLMCSSKPTLIRASGGYYLDGNSTHTIDIPLQLNTTYLEEGNDLVLTPATTMVSSLTDKEDIEAFALSIGLDLNTIYGLPTVYSQELYRYLNLINTLAAENGISDIAAFRNFAVDKIKSKGPVLTFAQALTNIKDAIAELTNNTDLITAFTFGLEGFKKEFNDINVTDISASLKKYALAQNDVVFTGYIYDKLIPGATITASLNGVILKSVVADANGKWKIELDLSGFSDTSLIIFTAVFPKLNGKTDIEFKSMISAGEIGNSKKVNLIDNSSLALSNVTTAEYVLVEKAIADKNSSTWTSQQIVQTKKDVKENQAALLLDLSAAIKVIVDTNISVPENTLAFAQKILKESQVTTNTLVISFDDYNSTVQADIGTQLPIQRIAIQEDIVLNAQTIIEVKEEVIIEEPVVPTGAIGEN